MRPLTLYVSDEVYSSYQQVAAHRKTKAAALIRSAMERYLEEELSKAAPLEHWRPLDLGAVRQDWIDREYQEEMLDARY